MQNKYYVNCNKSQCIIPGKVSPIKAIQLINIWNIFCAWEISAWIHGKRTDLSSVNCCIQVAAVSLQSLTAYGISQGANASKSRGHRCSARRRSPRSPLCAFNVLTMKAWRVRPKRRQRASPYDLYLGYNPYKPNCSLSWAKYLARRVTVPSSSRCCSIFCSVAWRRSCSVSCLLNISLPKCTTTGCDSALSRSNHTAKANVCCPLHCNACISTSP